MRNTVGSIQDYLQNLRNYFFSDNKDLGLQFPVGETLDSLVKNRLYLCFILIGLALLTLGLYISIYKNSHFKKSNNMSGNHVDKYIGILESLIRKTPLRYLYKRLEKAIGYFMLQEGLQRRLVAIVTLIIPAAGFTMYFFLSDVLTLWYTKAATLAMCLMVPYYIFTLLIDYIKYKLRLKIPVLIDSFRSCFVTSNRIKPALLECSKNIDKSLGRIISRASDCSDLNKNLCKMRDRINDTWFSIFILLLLNYRENGGELIAQLYKLNRTITRYNNIEKKKNKRLIWYEVFAVGASIFSLPVILMLNKLILGSDGGVYYNTASSFSKVAIFSLVALLAVRLLRRL